MALVGPTDLNDKEKRGMAKPFSFTIKDFRNVEEEYLYSDEFTSYIFSWRLKVYPQGDTEGRKEGYMSAFIEAMDDTPKGCSENRTLTINLTVSGDTERGARRITKCFSNGKAECHGWSYCKSLSLLSSFSDLTIDVMVLEEDLPGYFRRKGIWPNGIQYIGWTKNTLREGFGVLIFPSFGKSLGVFRNDKKSGLFVDLLYNGERYEGQYVDDRRHGHGTYLFINGDKYEGEFVKDEINGYGEMYYRNGDYYKGRWVLGKRNGAGTIIYRDGSKYTGEWLNDKRSGRGTFVDNNGRKTEGEWEDDVLKTEGAVSYAPDKDPLLSAITTPVNQLSITHTPPKPSVNSNMRFNFPDKSHYIGVMTTDGKKTGYGIYHYANGDHYEGEFVDDKRHGQGAMKYIKGGSFTGTFENDKEKEGKGVIWNGQGKVEFPTGDVFVGSFINGKRAGYGTCYYANGDVYEGEWKEDKREGKGICKYEGFVTYNGNWKNDKRDGCGIEWHRSPESSNIKIGIYEGVWFEDVRHGCGVFVWPSGVYTKRSLRFMREYNQGNLVSEIQIEAGQKISFAERSSQNSGSSIQRQSNGIGNHHQPDDDDDIM